MRTLDDSLSTLRIRHVVGYVDLPDLRRRPSSKLSASPVLSSATVPAGRCANGTAIMNVSARKSSSTSVGDNPHVFALHRVDDPVHFQCRYSLRI